MQTTALVEDTAIDGRLGSEHGLSLYVQTGERRLLFDMGQTGLFLRLLRLWRRHTAKALPDHANLVGSKARKCGKQKRFLPSRNLFCFPLVKIIFSLLTKEGS